MADETSKRRAADHEPPPTLAIHTRLFDIKASGMVPVLVTLLVVVVLMQVGCWWN